MVNDNKQVFALFEGENGMRMTTTYQNPRQLLQVLLGVCEDLRESCAVEAVQRMVAVEAAKKGGLVGR